MVKKPKPGFSFTDLPDPAWKAILSFLPLRSLFTVQALNIKLSLFVNPSCETCLVDYRGWYNLKPKRRVNTYGSLTFMLEEDQRHQHREQLEFNLQLRNQKEAALIQEYEAKIAELQSELELSDEEFAIKLIQRLKLEVGQGKNLLLDQQRETE